MLFRIPGAPEPPKRRKDIALKLSLKHMLQAATTGGFGLLVSLGAQAQTVIKSPPVHNTAASKKFVRPADPKTLLPVLARVPSLNPQLYSHLTPQQQQAAMPGGTGNATKPKFGTTPYERVLQPMAVNLLSKVHPSQIPTGIGMKSAAKAASANPSLPVNFPGFAGTPSVGATLAGDASPVVASLSMDVDQDGKTDLVTVQNDGTVNVLLGSGTFSNLKVTSSNQPYLLNDDYFIFATEADMNKDGYPDLVVTDEYNTAAFVFINAKNGTFLPPVEYDFNFSSGAGFQTAGGGIAVGDINGDGYPDLVGVAFDPGFDQNYNPSTTISIVGMLNTGTGALGAALPEQTTTGFPGYINSGIGQVLLTDMNKDGKLDLIVPASGFDVNYNQLLGIPIMLGNGNGTFAAFPSTFPAPPASLTYHYDDSTASFATADVNGDGNPDLLFSLNYDTVYVALGNGDGTIQAPTVVVSNDGTYNNGGASLVQYADVNGDGNIDIIGYDGGFFAVYLGQGGGAFAQTPLVQLISGGAGLVEPLPADFNGDGKADIVEVEETTGAAGLFPQSAGTFLGVPAVAPPTETAQGFQTVAVGDVNGDGIPDIVAEDVSTESETSYDPSIVAGINDGKGNFTYSTLFTGTTLGNDQISGIEPFAVDLNGDGKADLILTSYTGLFVSLNNGDGTYAAPAALSFGNGAACAANYIDVGDVNGDGYPDIVAAYGGDASCYPYTGNVPSGFFVMLNNGKGSFTSSFTPFGLSAYLIKLADLNGDGKLDIAITDDNGSDGFYYLYDIPGNGDGTFNTGGSQYVMENTVVSSIIPGDFDGDGKTDLVVGVVTQVDGNGDVVYDTTGTYALKGNGDFTFQLPIQYTSGLYPISGAYADFNGDGRPDLALLLNSYDYYTQILSGNAATLINLGGGAFANGPAMFTMPNRNAGFLFTADMNGDGAVDALFSPQVQVGYGATGLSELFLNDGGISIALASSSATVVQDSNVTLTATLAPTVSSQTPTGTVTFYDNGTSLGAVQVSGGTASVTLSTLPVGNDAITASYSGDANFNAATASTAVKVTVSALPPAFILTAPAPSTLTVIQGQSGVATFTISSNATFSGNVTFTCTGAPVESSCTISPNNVTLGGGQTATVTAVVATTTPNNSYEAANRPADWRKTVGGISCASLLLFLLPGRRRKLRGVWTMLLIVGLGLTAMTSITGCGGGDKYPGTPVATSTLTINATSGSITESTTVVLTVTD